MGMEMKGGGGSKNDAAEQGTDSLDGKKSKETLLFSAILCKSEEDRRELACFLVREKKGGVVEVLYVSYLTLHSLGS